MGGPAVATRLARTLERNMHFLPAALREISNEAQQARALRKGNVSPAFFFSYLAGPNFLYRDPS